ncbi:MAG: hypothetical protein DWQ05_18515 [Calditrichaeota bacterium]|nr:MAG: hypothetical protein DWQ05_18515 [Calditrichota bacterium]
MKNFRFGAFEIFGYLVPGLMYWALILLAINRFSLASLFEKVSTFNFYNILAIFFFAHLTTLSLETVAGRFQKFTIKMIKRSTRQKRVIDIFKNENPEAKSDPKIDDYKFGFLYTFAEVCSPQTREKADTFSAMGNMAINLGFGLFLFAVINTFYWFLNFDFTLWPIMIFEFISSLLFSIILLLRAEDFKSYSHSHLLNAYYIITQVRDPNLKNNL